MRHGGGDRCREHARGHERGAAEGCAACRRTAGSASATAPRPSRGHRSAVSTREGGRYYGYKVHAAVDTLLTGQPRATPRQPSRCRCWMPCRAAGFDLRNAIADNGYDNGAFHDGCMDRRGRPLSRRVARLPPSGSRRQACARAGGRASTASGRSPGRTSTSAEQLSGAARPADVTRSPHGQGRPTAPLIPRHTKRSARSMPSC